MSTNPYTLVPSSFTLADVHTLEALAIRGVLQATFATGQSVTYASPADMWKAIDRMRAILAAQAVEETGARPRSRMARTFTRSGY